MGPKETTEESLELMAVGYHFGMSYEGIILELRTTKTMSLKIFTHCITKIKLNTKMYERFNGSIGETEKIFYIQ